MIRECNKGQLFRIPLVKCEYTKYFFSDEPVLGTRVYGTRNVRISVPGGAKTDVFRIVENMGSDGMLVELCDDIIHVDRWLEPIEREELFEVATPVDEGDTGFGFDDLPAEEVKDWKDRNEEEGCRDTSPLYLLRQYLKLGYLEQLAAKEILSLADFDRWGDDGRKRVKMIRKAICRLEEMVKILEWEKSSDKETRRCGMLLQFSDLLKSYAKNGDDDNLKKFGALYDYVKSSPTACMDSFKDVQKIVEE